MVTKKTMSHVIFIQDDPSIRRSRNVVTGPPVFSKLPDVKLPQTRWCGVGWISMDDFFAPCNSFQLEMFPKCDAINWCLQRSRTNCSYGVAINPEMDNESFNTESPFRILKFSFSRKQRKASGKNQNIRRFCANSCLGIVPSEIHVKSRCSNLSN